MYVISLSNFASILSVSPLHFSFLSHKRKPFNEPKDFIHLGKSFSCENNGFGLLSLKMRRRKLFVVEAVVKKRKELQFDNIIEEKKKLRIVNRIKNILVKNPDRIMPLKELGKRKREIKLPKGRRLIALLKKFPAVFEIVERDSLLCLRLTPEADKIVKEEFDIRNERESLLVTKLRKLLMMSLEKRMHIEKLAHLRTDLGLPMDFRTNLCHRYPEYFKVVNSDKGPVLELTSWDPDLAVSAAELSREKAREREIAERNLIIDRPPKFERPLLPKGLKLKTGERNRLLKFMKIPYISPYSDFKDLQPGSMEAEKHACSVIHELLSLTIEKRTLVDHLTHLRPYYKFSQQVRGMLIRHPEMFYISFKGVRNSVFLREAYHNSDLIEKDPLLICEEKLQALVNFNMYRRRRSMVQLTEDKIENDEARENACLGDSDAEETDGYLSTDEDIDNDSVDVDDDDWSEVDDDEEEFFSSKAGSFSKLDKAEILRQAARRESYPKLPSREEATVAANEKDRERW